MARRLPIGPMVSTTLAVAAANVALGYLLARALARGPIVDLGVTGVLGLLALAIFFAGLAFLGWRSYLRR